MQLSEDLSIELEALQAIYDSAVTAVAGAAAEHSQNGSAHAELLELQVELRLQLAPQTGGDESSVYVLATLGISVPPGYPQQPPVCSLITSKGLGDARVTALLAALQQASAEAAGDMALVQLAAAAQDFINAANSPEGDCPICMFPLAGGGNAAAQKLSCFHCMHRQCFLRWWQWSQAAEAARAATLRKEQGPAANRAVTAAGLVPDAQGRYRLACPACRAEVVPAELSPPPPPPSRLLATGTSTRAPAAQAGAAGSRAGATDSGDGNQAPPDSRSVQLPPQQMAVLRAQQAERAVAFERQRQQGGIIEDTGWGQSTSAPRQAPPQPPAPLQQAPKMRSTAHKPATPHPQRQAAAQDSTRAPAAMAAVSTANGNGQSAKAASAAASHSARRAQPRAGRDRRRGGGSTASAPGAPL